MSASSPPAPPSRCPARKRHVPLAKRMDNTDSNAVSLPIASLRSPNSHFAFDKSNESSVPVSPCKVAINSDDPVTLPLNPMRTPANETTARISHPRERQPSTINLACSGEQTMFDYLVKKQRPLYWH